MKRQRRAIHLILNDARRTLGMSQREFGEAVGASHRSASRWDAGKATPGEHHLHRLARLVHPRDRSLAAEVAEAVDETLHGLGLEAPPPDPGPRAEDLVDLLVLVAVEQTGLSPAAVRPALHAIMKRACQLRLTMDTAERALRPESLEKPADKDRKPQK